MEVDEAILIAKDAVLHLFEGTGHRLEEVEYHDNGDFEITLSFQTPDRAVFRPLGARSNDDRIALGIDASRVYKQVLVGSDGLVKSIKVRQFVIG